ncbi:O-antigen ligase family protein [Sphingomonas lenta]|uniref:O-antigen ligase family protein n=1 Tax=Sphingomonas lenta TaxID=1141887 RepID=UPI001595FEBB|nr:O-antigen ligase family protein [Sphingomonas lenta]
METTSLLARALPVLALAPLLILGLLAVLALTRRLPSPAGRTLVIVVGMRPLLSAAWQFTFTSSPVGLSWNALSSVLFFAAGLFVLRRRSISLLVLAPFIPLLGVAMLSGAMNDALPDLATYATKLGYLVVVALLVVDASERHGGDAVMRTLALALASPLVLQIAGLALGIVKQSELDGSAAYIGGYQHEASFAVLLCGTMLAICLVRRFDFRLKLAMVGWVLLGLLLANYRTALLAIAPLVALSLLADGARRFLPGQRAIMGAMLAVLVAAAGLGMAVTLRERFADLGVFVSRNTELIKPPYTFSIEDRHVLNGRPLIWSQYYYAWDEGTTMQHVFGFGPETWTGNFRVYAHNTLVSALYEVGVVGVICYLLLWAWFLLLAFLAPGPVRAVLVAAHLAFLLLNMATMPMWSIEGLIYYGLLCGYTAYQVRGRLRGPARAPVAPRFARTAAARA